MRISVEERFWAKVDKNGLGGCWLWTASRMGLGYGVFYRKGQSRMAHRGAYELFIGPIPEGLELDHLCRVHHCVNPDHLEPVTHRENNMRGIRGTGPLRQTHCRRGHPFDEVNTYTT